MPAVAGNSGQGWSHEVAAQLVLLVAGATGVAVAVSFSNHTWPLLGVVAVAAVLLRWLYSATGPYWAAASAALLAASAAIAAWSYVPVPESEHSPVCGSVLRPWGEQGNRADWVRDVAGEIYAHTPYSRDATMDDHQRDADAARRRAERIADGECVGRPERMAVPAGFLLAAGVACAGAAAFTARKHP